MASPQSKAQDETDDNTGAQAESPHVLRAVCGSQTRSEGIKSRPGKTKCTCRADGS